jgi:flagellar hook-associated protein 3 FlgL
MRTTPIILRDRSLRTLTRTTQDFSDVQRQLSTGYRFERASEDPFAASNFLAAGGQASHYATLERSQGAVTLRLEAENSAMDSVVNMMTRLRELLVSEGNATATAASRAATASEVNNLLQQVLQLGNTRVNGDYVFGGDASASPPFAGALYTGGAVAREIEILPGQRMVSAATGQTLFVDTGVLAVLEDAAAALLANDQAGILATINQLDLVDDNVGIRTADIGSRIRRLEAAQDALAGERVLIEERRDQANGVSTEEATARFLQLQISLQNNAAALGRVLELDLARYIDR